ncbi:hypothetical protein [Verminephrobacter aporrectodeae]|nr:hypothetical protein [Verminephrobacter aporrectodeae]
MDRYEQAFRHKTMAKLLPPHSATLQVVAQEVGALDRWRKMRS